MKEMKKWSELSDKEYGYRVMKIIALVLLYFLVVHLDPPPKSRPFTLSDGTEVSAEKLRDIRTLYRASEKLQGR